jgi:hypothetical protein
LLEVKVLVNCQTRILYDLDDIAHVIQQQYKIHFSQFHCGFIHQDKIRYIDDANMIDCNLDQEKTKESKLIPIIQDMVPETIPCNITPCNLERKFKS